MPTIRQGAGALSVYRATCDTGTRRLNTLCSSVRHLGPSPGSGRHWSAPYDCTVGRVGVYATRATGDSALTVRRREWSGTKLEKTTFVHGVDGAVIPEVGSVEMWQAYKGPVRQPWLTRDYASPARLREGQTYDVEVSAPAGTLYWVHAQMDFRTDMYSVSYANAFQAGNGWPAASTTKAQFSKDGGSTWSAVQGGSSSRMHIPEFLRVASIP